MVLAFAFSFIAILLVLGNYKLLRRAVPLVFFFIISFASMGSGIYLLLNVKSEEPYLLMPMMSPAVALLLLEASRMIFLKLRKLEIIMYLGGFLPKKHEERFVTGADKAVTFLIVAVSMIAPYLLAKLLNC
jgi:hypothetical protein